MKRLIEALCCVVVFPFTLLMAALLLAVAACLFVQDVWKGWRKR